MENIKTIENFNKWKKTLHKIINTSEKVGVNEETIANIGKKFGDFLEKNVDPENREQRLIKELWSVGTEEEKKALTNMLIKMIETEHHSIH